MTFKRNCFEAGRFAAGIIAVILIVMIPLRSIIQKRITGLETLVQTYLDEFTTKIGRNGIIGSSDYEKLLCAISETGMVCEIVIGIERNSEIGEDAATNAASDDEFPVPDDDPARKGYTAYISNDEILAKMRNEGRYRLNENDSVSVSLEVQRFGGFIKIAEKLYVTGSFKKKYTSGFFCR